MEPESVFSVKTAKKEFSRLGWALFAIVVITSALQIGLGAAVPFFPGLENAPWMIWLLTFLPLYLVGVPVGMLILKKLPADNPTPAKLTAKQFFTFLLICFPIMYAGNILGTFLSLALSGGNAENVLMDYVMDSPGYTFLFAVLIAPVLEEYLFRKALLDRCVRYGETTAMLFSAFTFALFHMNLFQFFYAFGLGLLFAYVYIRTRMVRYPIFMHMIINFLGSIIGPWILSFLDGDIYSLLESGEADMAQLLEALPGLLVYSVYNTCYLLIVIAGFVLLIIRWKKRVILPAPRELPGNLRVRTAYGNPGVIVFSLFCLIMTGAALFV